MKRLLLVTAFIMFILGFESKSTNQVQLAGFEWNNRPLLKNTPKDTDIDSTRWIRIAVFDFENKTGDPALSWLESGLSNMFTNQLQKTSTINILNMIDLADAATRLKYKVEDLYNTIAAIRTAKEADADLILSGNFYQNNDSLYIDILLKNIHTGNDLCRETVRGHGMEQLLAMVDTISTRIWENIPKKIQDL